MLRPDDQTASRGSSVPEAVRPERLETTHSLLYRFQVMYREVLPNDYTGPHIVRDGKKLSPLDSMFVWAETKGEASWLFQEDPDIVIRSIGPGQPDIPLWKEIFEGRDEIAAFRGIEAKALDTHFQKGKMPKCHDSKPRLSKAAILKVVRVNKNQPD